MQDLLCGYKGIYDENGKVTAIETRDGERIPLLLQLEAHGDFPIMAYFATDGTEAYLFRLNPDGTLNSLASDNEFADNALLCDLFEVWKGERVATFINKDVIDLDEMAKAHRWDKEVFGAGQMSLHDTVARIYPGDAGHDDFYGRSRDENGFEFR